MPEWIDTEIGQIPSSWKICKIGEIANVTKLAGYEYTKFFTYVEDGEIIALRALNIREGVLDLSDIKRIYRDVSDNLIRSKLFKGDILFTYVGANIGQFALVEINDLFHLGPNICRIRTESNCLPYFLYCYFRTSYFKDNLINYSVGSSQPTMPMGNVRQIKVPIPPLNVQVSITSVLSSFDKKIDLLHRQNSTLEKLCETLFERWFMDEIDASWNELSLAQIGKFLNGLALQKYPSNGIDFLPVIKIRELNQGITENTEYCSSEIPSQYIIGDGDILFSWSGSLTIALWFGGKGALNQHLFKVTSEKYPKWLLYFALKHHLEFFQMVAESKSTTMGHIQREHLSEAKLFIPPKNILYHYQEAMEPLFNKLEKNNLQIRTLTQLRDTLLSKLMNGEVQVKIE